MRKLNKVRKEMGISAAEMASRIGVTLNYYRKIEAGTRTGNVELWDKIENTIGIHQTTLREKL